MRNSLETFDLSARSHIKCLSRQEVVIVHDEHLRVFHQVRIHGMQNDISVRMLHVQKLRRFRHSNRDPDILFGSANLRVQVFEEGGVPIEEIFGGFVEGPHLLCYGHTRHELFIVDRFVFNSATFDMEVIDEIWNSVEDIVADMGYNAPICYESLDSVPSTVRDLSKDDAKIRAISPSESVLFVTAHDALG